MQLFAMGGEEKTIIVIYNLWPTNKIVIYDLWPTHRSYITIIKKLRDSIGALIPT